MGCGCGSVVKLLADYLERQLPPALRLDLEAHLARIVLGWSVVTVTRGPARPLALRFALRAPPALAS